MKSTALLLAVLACAHAAAAAEVETATAQAALSPDQRDFFEKKIRPVLADNCYKCHSEQATKVRGGLLLDTREGIRKGGDNGHAVVPGDLKESLLIDAVRYGDKETAMPPSKNGGKLPDAVIKDLEAWVAMGAPDPRESTGKVVKKYDPEMAKKWWSFQPVKAPTAPKVKATPWPRDAIDTFVLAGLEAKGIRPVADADRLTLLRRVYFDLTGLPPGFREIDAFMRDASPDAFGNVVDRLLSSPQFGERWGRHWLDVARYAETTGKDVNFAYPHAWRYRDYVIDSFNRDKPYDRFLREQIAGDLLPAENDQQRAEQLVATGFLAIGTKSLNEGNPRQFALDLADEQIDTTSQAVLGLTVACARCHDHKFDPIPQRDYYAMAGIFLSTETRYGTAEVLQNRRPAELLALPPAAGARTVLSPISAEEVARRKARLEELKNERREAVENRPRPGAEGVDRRKAVQQLRALQNRVGLVENELESYDENGTPLALAMGAQDRPAPVADAGFGFRGRGRQGRFGGGAGRAPFGSITNSPLFARGDVDKPGERVQRGFLTLLTTGEAPAIPPRESGRRELAEWLTAPQNPLTARVMANRIWHWLFGQGIVGSTDNFGTTGEKPSNPELLDHLATRLVENGWSLKKTIREIVLSRTYQLASTFQPENFAADPQDTLVWRQEPRRLDAECIRDAMLSLGGNLDLKRPLGSQIAAMGDGPVARRRGRGGEEDSLVDPVTNVRSVYLAVARDLLPDGLAAFDFADPSLVTGVRETTNVPSQALFLLNSPFASTQASGLAQRVIDAWPAGLNGGYTANLDQRISYAYWMTLCRAPDLVEREAARTFFNKFPANPQKGDAPPPAMRSAADAKAAWTSFCRALFASAEFRYLN